MQRGVSVNAGRKLAMLACAIAIVPIVFAYRVSGLWQAVLLIGLAAAGHQGFSANLYTLTSDLFPKRAVASVMGVAGMAGAGGGNVLAPTMGYGLRWSGNLTSLVCFSGSLLFVRLARARIYQL